MRKAFVIVSVSDRVEQLNNLLKSIRAIKKYDDFDICVLYQDYLGNIEKLDKRYIKRLFIYKKRLGCNCARILLLNQIKYDIYCNLDDDMELTEHTNYQPVIDKLVNDRNSGFILTNWARTRDLYEQKVPNMKDTFVKQCFIYQGGGMLYRDDVADFVRQLPLVETVFDEGWALTAYLNGYENYRYLGSLALHFICTKGGMRDWYKSVDYSKLQNLFPEFINYRKGKNGIEYHIPMDTDLTEKAKEMHKMKKEKFYV